MSNSFFNLTPEIQKAWFRKVGEHFDLPDTIIEKDLWICWILEKLFALPIPMVFKGGTSLSKVFGLIHRFSEDCDITIDYRHFIPELDFKNISRTQLAKASDKLRAQLKIYISTTVLPHLKENILAHLPYKNIEITLSEDGEQLRFFYPSVNALPPEYLRDHVLIEFGMRNSIEPCEKYEIVPYLSSLVNNEIQLPRAKVDTLSPIRTFWEKATLIHVECHRNRFSETPERLSRHWYDLFMLYQSKIGEQALSRKDILESVLVYKKAFFNASYAHYDNCSNGLFKLIPEPLVLDTLKKDFNKMISAGMFSSPPPSIDEIITKLVKLETTINS